MALTKVTGQVINNTTGLVVGVTTVGGGVSATDGFFSGIVTAVGNASFSGSVSVGGTLTYEDVTNVDSVGLVTARNGIVVGSGITLSKDGDGFFTGVVTATSYYGDGSNLSNITSTTINSNADNRLITGSGTANTLNGESNVTYDGSTLQIATDANLEGFKIISSGDTYSDINISANRGSANNSIGRIKGLWNDTQVASIEFKTGADTSGKDDGEITFHTSNGGGTLDERVRIFQNGSVVIGSKAGEAGGSAKLAIDCQGLDINDGVGDAANYGLIFANDPTGDKANGIGFFNDSASTCGGYIVHQDKGAGNIGDIVMATSASSDTPVERFRIASAGDVTVSTGNLIIGTSGKGIDFSADSGSAAGSTSALLDDYEEGTWTPQIQGTSGAGTASYSTQRGRYVKVGNLVYITGYCGWTSGSAGGELRVTGLPFSALSNSEGIGSCMLHSVPFRSGSSPVVIYLGGGTNYTYFYQSIDNGTWLSLDYDSAGYVIFNVTYRVS